MSFWRNFGFYTVSSIETTLNKPDFTLEDLLDDDEILQEVKAQNKKLIDVYVPCPYTLEILSAIDNDDKESGLAVCRGDTDREKACFCSWRSRLRDAVPIALYCNVLPSSAAYRIHIA